jgi:hypothetical protein
VRRQWGQQGRRASSTKNRSCVKAALRCARPPRPCGCASNTRARNAHTHTHTHTSGQSPRQPNSMYRRLRASRLLFSFSSCSSALTSCAAACGAVVCVWVGGWVGVGVLVCVCGWGRSTQTVGPTCQGQLALLCTPAGSVGSVLCGARSLLPPSPHPHLNPAHTHTHTHTRTHTHTHTRTHLFGLLLQRLWRLLPKAALAAAAAQLGAHLAARHTTARGGTGTPCAAGTPSRTVLAAACASALPAAGCPARRVTGWAPGTRVRAARRGAPQTAGGRWSAPS